MLVVGKRIPKEFIIQIEQTTTEMNKKNNIFISFDKQ